MAKLTIIIRQNGGLTIKLAPVVKRITY